MAAELTPHSRANVLAPFCLSILPRRFLLFLQPHFPRRRARPHFRGTKHIGCATPEPVLSSRPKGSGRQWRPSPSPHPPPPPAPPRLLPKARQSVMALRDEMQDGHGRRGSDTSSYAIPGRRSIWTNALMQARRGAHVHVIGAPGSPGANDYCGDRD